ncbi:TolC family protein [Chryseobacterium sp. DT-3]|uniref:TolC family protein n=1 Tax=Chryseobacterium sp. DT-3 TaxID=3396164 RepID=UPI003F1A9189
MIFRGLMDTLITLKTIENRKEEVKTMKALMEVGTVNGAAEVQSEANLYATEVTVPDLQQSIRETENIISLLLSKTPGPIERSTLDEQKVYEHINTGIPMQLLHNRPDVQSAELSFRAYFENTNVARSNFYPTLSISAASAGLSSLSIEKLFTNSI